MFERFTDRARKVMALANQEAMRFNHEYIGTEHILLGLVKEGGSVGANVLKNLEVDLGKVRLEVEKLIREGPPMVTMGKLPQTPRAKKVIEYAIEEARNLNHRYVGTEHFLLGLLREQEGVAAQILLNMSVKLEEVREEVLNLLGAGKPEDVAEEDPRSVNSPVGKVLPRGLTSPSLRTVSADELIAVLLQRFDADFKRLEAEKDELVRQADYEKAAALRDQILALVETKSRAILKILGVD